MGMAVDGLCPPSAGLQRNQWCTFSRPAAAAFFPYKPQCKNNQRLCLPRLPASVPGFSIAVL